MDEKGIALITALMVMVMLTILGLAAIMTSTTEMQIAGNEKTANRAFYAAEAGINEAIARFNLPTGDANLITADVANPAWNTAFNRTLSDGSSYSVTVAHKPDTDNLDGDTTTTIVYYARSFNYDNSTATDHTDGYPVEVITVGGTDGTSQSTVVLELSKQPIDVQVEGGLTANSNVRITGNVVIGGDGVDLDGNPDASCDPLPGVATSAGNTIDADGSTTISPAGTVLDATYDPPDSPWEALGFTSQPESIIETTSLSLPFAGINYFTKNVGAGEYYNTNNITGTGILIVHNPNYDPLEWDVSRPTLDDGTANPSYNTGDADYNALLDNTSASYDATYETSVQPARLGMITGGVFKGVIIADYIDHISGNTEIYGALISLGSTNIEKVGTGTPIIQYSCEAIDLYASEGYTQKLSWRRQ